MPKGIYPANQNRATDRYKTELKNRSKKAQKDHANRLKAIGNGQVSLTMATAWLVL